MGGEGPPGRPTGGMSLADDLIMFLFFCAVLCAPLALFLAILGILYLAFH